MTTMLEPSTTLPPHDRGVQTAIVTITPEMAAELLTHNSGNRKINRARVAFWSSQIARGQWMMTGEAVKVSLTGRLLDGQHRLTSVIETGVPITTVYVTGLPDEAQEVMDSGFPRSWAFVLQGVTNSSNKTAACRMMAAHDLGLDPRERPNITLISRPDTKLYYLAHEDAIEEFDRVAWKLYGQVGGNQNAWMAFLVFADRASRSAREDFITGVMTGANLNAGDPRLALRSFYSSLPGRKPRSNASHLGLLIKTWNLWLDGEARELVKFGDAERWPTMKTIRSLQSRERFG